MRSAAGDQALIDAMDLAGPPGRKAVAATLAALRSTASLAVLRRAAAADPDLEVRRICALLLAQ